MRITEARFFILAAVLHAALPVAAFIAPQAEVEAPGLPIEVDVEVEVEPPPPAPQVEATRVEPPPAPSTEDAAPSPRSERPTGAARIEPGPVPSVAPTAEPNASATAGGPPGPGPAPTGKSEYDGVAPSVPNGPTGPLVGVLPGMGGSLWNTPGVGMPDMGRPKPAPTTSPQTPVDPKIATKVITDAMKEKDKGLGLELPGSGTIATSVRQAVQATETPPESRATFEVRLSPTGQIVSVRVTSSSGGSGDTWSRAAAAAAAALKGRVINMTAAYAKGATVYVHVHSTTTLPDGSKSAVSRKGAGASFDLSSIGAHMQRVVRVSHNIVAVQ